MTSKSYLILLSCFILKQALVAQVVPPPATQAEVDAGANRFKYVTPYTLANSGLISGPTNGVTATTATNIVNGIISLENLGTLTNADMKSFTVSDKILLSKRIHPSSEGYEFWDDFNRTITNSPGVSPSGHTWGFSSASGVNSNVVFVQDGAFKIATNAQAGATYWGITNSNPNTVWNKFKGSFLYREYDANGFRQNLGFILANNYFRGGTNWLHVGINQNGFYAQRELADFFINELFATELETDVEHTYEILLSDDKLWARVAGNYYFVQDDAITNYTSFPVVIYEHNMKMTNRPAQYFGEWLSAAAGQFESPIVNMAKPFSFSSNSVALTSVAFSDSSSQTTAASNSVVVAAGTGGITVTPSGSGGVMTYTISDDDAGGGGGGGGTNFPNVNLLLGNTNLVLSAGVRKAFHNQTNGSHGINLNLAVPESGYVVTYSVSNSSSSDITVTFYTNSVAANPYDIATKTNVNTFTASASAITEAQLKYIGSGIWVLESVKAPAAVLKFGSGITATTNGVNGLDVTISASGGSGQTSYLIGGQVSSISLTTSAKYNSPISPVLTGVTSLASKISQTVISSDVVLTNLNFMVMQSSGAAIGGSTNLIGMWVLTNEVSTGFVASFVSDGSAFTAGSGTTSVFVPAGVRVSMGITNAVTYAPSANVVNFNLRVIEQ